MTPRILHDRADSKAVLYDESTLLPIGRVTENRIVKGELIGASKLLERFMAWTAIDPRTLSLVEYELHYAAFIEYIELDSTHELIGKPTK